MAPTVPTADTNVSRLENVLIPYLRQLLKDAPDFGEVSFTATLHDGEIARVELGAVVARKVAPRADRRRA
jgi:hypothetical protein